MSITLGELKIYGSASMPDDDTPTGIGGAIATAKTVEWVDAAGTVQGVSSSSGDTTQSVTVSYRDVGGVIQTLVIALNGQTVVTNAAVTERLLKGIKSATTGGDVAVEKQTAEFTGSSAGATSNTITIGAGASAVDDFYRGMIIREPDSSSLRRIWQIVSYNGTTKIATLDHETVGALPSAVSIRISKGFFFAKLPAEVTEVRRPFYNASADPSLTKTYYEKTFIKNTSTGLALTSSFVAEFADPSGKITFALATAKDDTGTNGGGNNRQVAPSSGVTVFDNSAKDVPSSSLGSGEAIGVWLKLTLAPGDTAQNTTYTPRIQGATI